MMSISSHVVVFFFNIIYMCYTTHLISQLICTVQWFLANLQTCAALTTVLFWNTSITPKRSPVLSLQSLPILPPPPDTTSLLPVSLVSPSLDVSYKWNHTVCGLSCLASFTWRKGLGLVCDVAWVSTSFLYCWVVVYCMDIDHILFSYLLIDGHLGCFLFFWFFSYGSYKGCCCECSQINLFVSLCVYFSWVVAGSRIAGLHDDL